ncbi:hypothetical protein B566_EDAN011217 [Ephemera danica]|nr:hypothetical protein B566_EDAN011217 [Ephemera danica]
MKLNSIILSTGLDLQQQIDEYSTSGLHILMAATPNNNSSPPCIVTRSRFNKGGVQLLPPLSDNFFSTKRQSQTPPTEKGSRARKRSLSRRHTTTGIEMKMETADLEVSVKKELKTETEEVSGEPNVKKEPATSSLSAALCEELLRYPLVKLEKCSPVKETRTQEPPVEEDIDVMNEHEPITPKLDSLSPVLVDAMSDHKEEPVIPKLKSKSPEPKSSITPKLESKSPEPKSPITPKVESNSSKQNSPLTPKLESKSPEPNSPITPKLESKSTEPNSPITPKLESKSPEPNNPLTPKLVYKSPEQNNPLTPKLESKSAEPNSPITPKLESKSSESNSPITPNMTPEPKSPEIDKSPRVANTPPTFRPAVQTTLTPPTPNRTIAIMRRRNGRSLLISTPSSPVWQRNMVRSYSLPLVPVTTTAASSSFFAIVQPGQRVPSTLTSGPCISRTPSPVAKFPTSQSLILSPEIESSATVHFSCHGKEQSGKSILKEQLTAPRNNVPKPVITPKREPVNAMRKIFKSKQNSRTPKARGKLGLKIAQALDISLEEVGVKARSPNRVNQRKSIGDSKNQVLSYNEMWCSNESRGTSTLTLSPQASTSRTPTWQPMKLLSPGTSTSATLTSQTLPYNTLPLHPTSTCMTLATQHLPTFNTLTLQPSPTYKVMTSQTTPVASESVTSKTLFVYEVLVPHVAAICEIQTSQVTSTCEGLSSQATTASETQMSQSVATCGTMTPQAISTSETVQESQFTPDSETSVSQATLGTDQTLASQATFNYQMIESQGASTCETLTAQVISTCKTMASQSILDIDETLSQATSNCEMLESQAAATCETWTSEAGATCEELTAIFEEDWNYQVTLDSVLHSNAPGLWHDDEMNTLMSQYNLDKCLFNDETPALFELVGYNEGIEDFTSTASPSMFMQQQNLPENIFDDSDSDF